jgi:hypothetical protein
VFHFLPQKEKLPGETPRKMAGQCVLMLVFAFAALSFPLLGALALTQSDGVEFVENSFYKLPRAAARSRACILARPTATGAGNATAQVRARRVSPFFLSPFVRIRCSPFCCSDVVLQQLLQLGGTQGVGGTSPRMAYQFEAIRNFAGAQTTAGDPLNVTIEPRGSFLLQWPRAKCIGVTFPPESAHAGVAVVAGDTGGSIPNIRHAVEVLSFDTGSLSNYFDAASLVAVNYGRVTEQMLVAGLDYVFYAGGIRAIDAELLPTTLVFDMASGLISQSEPLPMPAMGIAGAYVTTPGNAARGIVLAGGCINPSGGVGSASSDIVFFQEAANRTFAIVQLIGSFRQFGAAASANGVVFVVGGFDETDTVNRRVEVVRFTGSVPEVFDSGKLDAYQTFAALSAVAVLRDFVSGGADWHILLLGGCKSFVDPVNTVQWGPEFARNSSVASMLHMHADPQALPNTNTANGTVSFARPTAFASAAVGPPSAQQLIFVGGGETDVGLQTTLKAVSLVDTSAFTTTGSVAGQVPTTTTSTSTITVMSSTTTGAFSTTGTNKPLTTASGSTGLPTTTNQPSTTAIAPGSQATGSTGPTSSDTGLVVGIVVAAVSCVVLILIAGICAVARNRRQRDSSARTSEWTPTPGNSGTSDSGNDSGEELSSASVGGISGKASDSSSDSEEKQEQRRTSGAYHNLPSGGTSGSSATPAKKVVYHNFPPSSDTSQQGGGSDSELDEVTDAESRKPPSGAYHNLPTQKKKIRYHNFTPPVDLA